MDTPVPLMEKITLFGIGSHKLMTCPICNWTPEEPKYLFIHESQYWRSVLAPNQCLLGRCVVHLKRHCGDLAELSEAELLDCGVFVKRHQNVVRKAFDARMFNWSVYLNHAYRETPPNPHIHWWVVPRYDRPVQFAGLMFNDPQFGSPYDHARWQEVPPSTHLQIAQTLRKVYVEEND